MNRVAAHPILPPGDNREVRFFFRGRELTGYRGEPVTSALIAGGIHIFGEHPKDGASQGLFCANGQCSQCTVLVNGIPVKGCMTPLEEGMRVEPCIGRPVLPEEGCVPEEYDRLKVIHVPFLVIGGGPAGLSAACELGRLGLEGLLVDDRPELGGKLCLQTHKFFGSREACYAGVRGIDIAGILERDIEETGKVEIWRNSPAIGVFADRKVGIMKDGREYVLVEPEVLLTATGARERNLVFPGCDLPGVMGAGAFQTLVNRDRVLPGKRLFILGGGNVGLIVAYHALQAGMEVAGLAEFFPECSGYLVHEDKIRRLGVPIFTGHTVLHVEGSDHVNRITIAGVDGDGRAIQGTEKRFDVDTVLVAVGLSPVDELYHAARNSGMKVYAAGDAAEISEASAAMFGGKIGSLRMAGALGKETGGHADWEETMDVLKARPGQRMDLPVSPRNNPVYPVIRCVQEIPCNPCTEVCPLGAIKIENGGLLGIPSFQGDRCTGCGKCVLVCPGLAITLVREGSSGKTGAGTAEVTVPWEMSKEKLEPGSIVRTVDRSGRIIGTAEIKKIGKGIDRCALVTLVVPFEHRLETASILPPLSDREKTAWTVEGTETPGADDTVVCRCERVTRGEIAALIRRGYRDMNSLKAALRVGMGACGGKTCEDLIRKIFQEEGVPPGEVTGFSKRPPLQEVPLARYAGIHGDGGSHGDRNL